MARIKLPKQLAPPQAEQQQAAKPSEQQQPELTPAQQAAAMLDSVPVVVPQDVRDKRNANCATHKIVPIPESEGLSKCQECGAAEAELGDYSCEEYKAGFPLHAAASTPTEPAASPAPEPAPADPIVPHTEQDELLDEISRAEQECAAAESVVTELKGELKEAKKDYETCVKRLRKLARRAQADADRPLFSQGAGDVADKSLDANASDSAAANPDAWKLAPVTSLDLKPKLLERLQEHGIDTIGRLESLRADIALGKEKWPKGIGQAKVTEIENAVVAWLTANRDAGLFNGQGEGVAAGDSAATSGAEQVTGTHGDAPPPSAPESSIPSATEWDLWPDEKRADWVNERAAQISESMLTGDELQRTGSKLTAAFQSGEIAYGRDEKATDCPYIPGDEMNDWLSGFFCAARWEEQQGGSVSGLADTEQPEAENAEPEFALAANLDDI